MADFISYDGFIGSVLVVVVGWWSGGYIGVGDHPLVFVVIIFYHFFYVLQSLLLLFAVLLQYVDDFHCFAFRISGSALSP